MEWCGCQMIGCGLDTGAERCPPLDKAGKAVIGNALGNGQTSGRRPTPAPSGALSLPLASSGQYPAFCFLVSKTQEKTRQLCKLTLPHITLSKLQRASLLLGTRSFAHILPFASSALPHAPSLYTFAKPALHPPSEPTLNSPAWRHCPLHPLFSTFSTFIHPLYVPFID